MACTSVLTRNYSLHAKNDFHTCNLSILFVKFAVRVKIYYYFFPLFSI